MRLILMSLVFNYIVPKWAKHCEAALTKHGKFLPSRSSQAFGELGNNKTLNRGIGGTLCVVASAWRCLGKFQEWGGLWGELL